LAAYYNEHDPFAAAWLRELIKAGHIAPGEVDERSIEDVQPSDVAGFRQCHWFAGIGGWSYALRLAGWNDDRPVWTGSCPCQPFSTAGRREGGADDRHLWPHWARLISECQPVAIFGEQVESAIAHGWLDAVFDDLEGQGYACGAVCIPAAGVGAFHLRQRLWFVAESECWSTERHGYQVAGTTRRIEGSAQERERLRVDARNGGYVGVMADAEGCDGGLQLQQRRSLQARVESERSGEAFWSDAVWIDCRDGKRRPTQPEIFPLAAGIPNRLGLLRGAGNSIVPQVAAEVIRAYMDITD
jgi:DNA (cytosine-5)-methyltransferase 1